MKASFLQNLVGKKFCTQKANQKSEKLTYGFTYNEMLYFMEGKSGLDKMFHNVFFKNNNTII